MICSRPISNSGMTAGHAFAIITILCGADYMKIPVSYDDPVAVDTGNLPLSLSSCLLLSV